MQRRKLLQCSINTWRKWHHKRYRVDILEELLCDVYDEIDRYKLRSLYVVFKAKKG